MPPDGRKNFASITPFCRGNAGLSRYKLSTVVQASFAPRRAAQGGARLTLPGASLEHNGGASPPVRNATTGVRTFLILAFFCFCSVSSWGKSPLRQLRGGVGCRVGDGYQPPDSSSWAACQGVGRRLCPYTWEPETPLAAIRPVRLSLPAAS